MTAPFRLAAALALLVAVAEPASATTLAPLTVDQMTDASDVVARGTVEEIWTDLDEHLHVVSFASVRVTEVLKGDALVDDYVVVETPGGVWEGAISLVAEAARYDEGEDVVLFLASKRHGSAWGTVAMSRGKYTVRQNPADGSDMVVRFTQPWDKPFDHRFIPHPPAAERVSLASLESQVRARVALGWDGKPIPGVSADHLRAINRLQPGVK
ncbi:MAG: hypothetical protein ACOZNI_16880 [Myxococcota bacterium]